jgi:antitoxin VapB
MNTALTEAKKPVTTTRIDRSGTGQSVRLPDGFQFDVDEVEILRRGDEVILRKKPENLREAFDLLASMPDDYFAEGRQDPVPEKREAL